MKTVCELMMRTIDVVNPESALTGRASEEAVDRAARAAERDLNRKPATETSRGACRGQA